jgi:hypothetical protein
MQARARGKWGESALPLDRRVDFSPYKQIGPAGSSIMWTEVHTAAASHASRSGRAVRTYFFNGTLKSPAMSRQTVCR